MAKVMGIQVTDGPVIIVRDVTYIGFGVVRTVDREIRPVVIGK